MSSASWGALLIREDTQIVSSCLLQVVSAGHWIDSDGPQFAHGLNRDELKSDRLVAAECNEVGSDSSRIKSCASLILLFRQWIRKVEQDMQAPTAVLNTGISIPRRFK